MKSSDIDNCKKERVLIITDSLGADRPDGIPDDFRWPNIVKRTLLKYRFKLDTKTYRTSDYLKTLSGLSLHRYAIIVIQLGIVDCTPRYFSRLQHKILSNLPKLMTKKIVHYVKNSRIQSNTRRYVQPKAFKKNISDFAENYNGKIVFIGILRPSAENARKNPKLSGSISRYNRIVQDIVRMSDGSKFLSLDEYDIDNMTLADGYHLNKKGHASVANLIITELDCE